MRRGANVIHKRAEAGTITRMVNEAPAQPKPAAANRLWLMGLALAGILALAGAGALAFFELRYFNRAYPGVKLQGRDLSGMTAQEIFAIAQNRSAAYYNTATLNLQTQDNLISFRPADFGAGIDPAATAHAALQAGRQGSIFERLRDQFNINREGYDIRPAVVMDEAQAQRVIGHIAQEVRRDPVDAKVQIASGVAREIPSQQGAALDADGLILLVKAMAIKGEPATLPVPLKPVAPKIASAANAANEAAQIIGRDLVVQVPQYGADGARTGATEAFRIVAANLHTYILAEQGKQADGTPVWQIRILKEKFRSLVEPLAKAVNAAPVNAKLEYDPATARVSSLAQSQMGHTLDVNATLDAIEKGLRGDARTVEVARTDTSPKVSSSMSAADLGITGLITQATTFFKGSSAARLKNVEVAASRFNGVVIPPGGIFSFADYLGDVSVESGFEEGLIIVGDKTIPGVGGGVCQVSTTAFQAALRAGFPILERTPHAYRVSYYENGMGPGFDAAVFTPQVDMKFKNDSPAHLLIKTVYDPKAVTLTFKFYGALDGRQVSFTKPVISNIVAHGPDIYERDPEGKAAPGKARQVDHAVDGATINVSRIVTKDGVARKDNFASKYVAWQARYYFGEGFVPPADAIVR